MAKTSEKGKVTVTLQESAANRGYGATVTFEDARFHCDGALEIERDGETIALFTAFEYVTIEASKKEA